MRDPQAGHARGKPVLTTTDAGRAAASFLADVRARGPESAVTAPAPAVLAAGTAVRPLEKS